MAQTGVFPDLNGSAWKIWGSKEDTLAVLESIKMEIPLLAPVGGKVKKILVVEGQSVSEHTPVISLIR